MEFSLEPTFSFSRYPAHRNLFQEHLAIVRLLCDHFQEAAGLKVEAIYPHEVKAVEQKYLSLSLEKRRQKMQMTKRYYDFVLELERHGRSLLSEKKAALRAFTNKYGLKIPCEREVYSSISDDTFVEIYDRDFIQVYRSPDFVNVTGHSFMKLETYEWWELFERPPATLKKQQEVVEKIYSGKVRQPVYRPIENHSVTEINSPTPRVSQAESVLYAPVFDLAENFQGGLHLFKVSDVKFLDFSVIESSPRSNSADTKPPLVAEHH